jgi:pyrroline-5-carboxylate reductase
MKKRKKIAIIGAGRIGQTLVAGILDANVAARSDLTVVTKHKETLAAVCRRFKVHGTLRSAEACKGADIVLISVKPQQMREVLAEIAPVITPKTLVITTVASAPTRAIEEALAKGVPVIRTMPNTPCLIRSGMVAITPGKSARKRDLELAEKIFGALGRTVIVDEKHMNAVTGLSGSGPAFMYIMIEALAEGGVKVGLPRDVATLLAAQTMRGSGAMVLETGQHPSMLKDAVTTPAGCTIDGICELEDGGIRVTLIKTVVKATQRAAELFA